MSETGSVGSSQRTATSVRSRIGARFFASSFPVFPFLLTLESDYHYIYTYIGMVVQIAQMLSFVLNPRIQHGETLRAFGRIIYASHLPLWDDHFASFSFNQYAGFFSVSVALILLPFFVSLWFILTHSPAPRESPVLVMTRGAIHLITSVLYIPLMQGLLSQLICLDGYLWVFPDVQCHGSAGSTATFVIGIVALVVLNFITLLVESTLFDDDYHSQHPLARKQYINSSLYTCWRGLSCILFYVFLSNTTKAAPTGYTYTWLPMYIFFSAGLMALSYVFYLPFLRQRTNRIFVGAFFTTAVVALIVFFSSKGAIEPRQAKEMVMSGLAEMDIDGLVVVAAGGVFFLLGWIVADWRVNSEMKRSLRQLTDAAAEYPRRYTCLFPKGLPEYDVAYRSYVEMCNDVADGAFKDNRVPVSLETPFLTHVYTYTDIEVATRFISTSHRITGLYPTAEMLSLATQIYMKGLCLYPESGSVLLDFASMINAFTMKPSLALSQCERVNSTACSFSTRYRAYRLQASLKITLHLRDTAYQSICEDAKRAHKEILVSLSQFWNKLLAQQTDRSQILSTYSLIARKREDTNKMFIKALQQQTSDRDLLLKYADFLEQVMLQPDHADKLRALAVKELEEEHRTRGQPGRTRLDQVRRRQTLAQIFNDTNDSTNHMWGIRIDSHNVSRICILLFITLVAVALIVVSVLGYKRRVSSYECIHYSSVARNLRLLGDLIAMQYFTVGDTFANSGPRLHAIVAVARDLLSIHNSIVFGRPSSITGSRENSITSPRTISVTFADPNTPVYEVTSYLSLGYEYAQFLEDLPGVIGRASASGGTTSGSSTAQRAAHQLETVRAALFDEFSRAWEKGGFNASVTACREWYMEERDVFVGVCAALFGLSVAAIGLYAEVAVLSSPVEKLKNRILSLFGFIPRNRLQEIALQARQRVEDFDRSGDAEGDSANEPLMFQEVDEDDGVNGDVASPSAPDNTGEDGDDGGDKTNPQSPSDASLKAKRDSMKLSTGEGEASADEGDTSENHALLRGTEKTDAGADVSGGGTGFLSRIGLGRKAGAEDDAAANGVLTTETNSTVGSVGGGGGLTSSGGFSSSSLGAKDRLRMVGPLSMFQQGIMVLVVVLLVIVLVLAAIEGSVVDRDRAEQLSYASRSIMYSHTQVLTIEAAFYLSSFFSSGDESLFDQYLAAVLKMQIDLPPLLGMSPEQSEVVLLRSVANAVSNLQSSMPTLTQFLNSPSGTTSQYDPVSLDVALNADGEAARATIFLDRGESGEDPTVFEETIEGVASALGAAQEGVYEIVTTESNKTTALPLTVVLIVLCAVSFIALIGIALAIHFINDPFFFRRSRSGTGFFVVSLLSVVTTFVLAVVMLNSVRQVADTRKVRVTLAGEHRRTVKSYLWPLVLAGQIAQQGFNVELLRVFEYFDYTHEDTLWRTFMDENSDHDSGKMMRTAGQRLFEFQRIALKLLTDANNFAVIELENVEWDFAAEDDAMDTRLAYPDPLGLRYSTTAADLLRSDVEKITMARDVLSNQRTRDIIVNLNAACDSFYHEQLDKVTEKTSGTYALISRLSYASAATSAVAVFFFCAFILLFLSQHGRHRREQLGLLNDALASKFSGPRTWMALGITFALFAAVFAVSMADLFTMPERDAQLDYLNERSFHVTRNMIAAELWAEGRLSSAELALRCRDTWNNVESLHSTLAYGKAAIYGTSAALDTLLKGSTVQLSPRFRYGFDPTVAATSSTSSPPQDDPDKYTFTLGLDSAVVSWMHRSLELVEAVEAPALLQAAASLKELRDTVMPLLRGLDEAAYLFLSAIEDRTRVFFVVSILLSAVAATCAIAIAVFLFLPVARQQAVEETGYRMLVRLIPPEIRESIPEVREFINSEATNKGGIKNGKAINAAMLVGGVSSALANSIGTAAFDDLSTPIIAITANGCVIKFNRQAEELFGYSAAEVLGNNVSILMPERIARRHDGYLASYTNLRKPGNRSVMQGQEVIARKKNGVLFYVRLTVHEMKRGNSERAFVGFVEDISAKVRARQELLLSRHIQDEAVVPMIAIDSLGTVLLFNKAAEECFGRAASEVIDQNVKILMPEDIAVRHDGYLATYLRTKEKHAIDNVARGRGVRKSGEEFPIELKVKEIVHDNVSTYVGFCRDLSMDAHLEEAVAINEAIFETSVIPVICTDMQGRVILYSRSAQRVFGYRAEEVVSNNCKMLMPDIVADHHDSYMDRYRSSWSRRNAPIMSRQVMGRHKDGHLIPLLASLHEVKSTSNTNTALVGFFQEMSEQSVLERGISVDDVIADYHQLALVVINSLGIIERVNQATLREFGYHHPEDLLHKNVKMLMPDEVAARHDDYLNRYILTGIGSMVNHSNDGNLFMAGRRVIAKRADGSTFPVEVRVREVRRNRDHSPGTPGIGGGDNPFTGVDGDVGGSGEETFFIGFIRNLSRDLRLERQMAINKTAMTYSPLPLWLLDANGRIAKMNTAAEKTFGGRSEELIGKMLTSILKAPNTGVAKPNVVTVTPVSRTVSAPSPPPVLGDENGNSIVDFLLPLLDKSTERLLVTACGSVVTVEVTVKAVYNYRGESAEAEGSADDEAATLADVDDHMGSMAQTSDVPQTFEQLQQQRSARKGRRPDAYMVCMQDTSEGTTAAVRSARSDAVAELSPVPLVHFDDEGRIVDVNPAAAKQLGYTRDEIKGSHVSSILPDPLILADMLLTGTSRGFDKAEIGGRGGDDDAAGTGSPQQPYDRTGDAARRKRVKTEMQTKSGRLIPVELCVAELLAQTSASTTVATFVAYMYDQSGSIQLEAAAETCQEYAELSPHPILSVKDDGTILTCNAAAWRTFRYEAPTQLLGQNVRLLLPDGATRESGSSLSVFQEACRSIQGGQGGTVQCRRADDTSFPVSVTLRQVQLSVDQAYEAERAQRLCGDEYENEVVYVMRLVDRSEESAIRCTTTFMESLLLLSRETALVFFTDSAEVRRVSDHTLTLLGYESHDELVGKPAAALIPGFNPADLFIELVSNGKKSVTRKRTVSVRRKDGTHFSTELHVRQVCVGNVTSFVACIVDARDREALHAKRKTNLMLVEHSPVPVLVMDPDGAVRMFSPSAEAFFGYSAAEIMSDDSADVLLLLPEMAEDRAVTTQLLQGRSGGLNNVTGNDSISDDEALSGFSGSGSRDGSSAGEIDAGLQRLLLAARGANDGGPAAPSAVSQTEPAGTFLRGRHARLRHGVVVPVDVSVVELPAADGTNQPQYAVFVVDRSLDNAVNTAQRLSDAVARSMPMPSVVVSEAGIILEANQHMAELVDYPISQLEGQPISITVAHKSLMNPSDTGTSMRSDEAVHVQRDVPLLTKGGHTKLADAHVCVLPARGARGGGKAPGGKAAAEPRILHITFVDHSATTDHLRVLQRFQTLFNSVSTPVMRLDATSLGVQSFNPAASRMFDLKCEVDGSYGAIGRHRKGIGAMTSLENEDGDNLAVLTDLMVNSRDVKLIKRFIARESKSLSSLSTTAADTPFNVPSFHLTTKMRVRAANGPIPTNANAQRSSVVTSTGAAAQVGDSASGAVNATHPLRTEMTGSHTGASDGHTENSCEMEVKLLLELINPNHVLLYVADVAAERVQLLHTSLLSALQSALREPCMVVSTDDVIISFNDAAAELLGYQVPLDGTILASLLVEGGIVAMYAEAALEPAARLAPGDTAAAGSDSDDVVMAYLELDDHCALAQNRTSGDVMKPTSQVRQRGMEAEPDSPYAPLPFSGNEARSSDATPLLADTHAEGFPSAGRIDQVEGGPTAGGDEGCDDGHVIRTELRSRQHLVKKVPCRCKDGRVIQLDLRLCEIEIPMKKEDPEQGEGEDGEHTVTVPGVSSSRALDVSSSHDFAFREGLRPSDVRDDAAEKTSRYYIVFLDDTVSRQQLETSIELGDAIIEKHPSPVVMTNTAGIVVRFNAAAERLFKFNREHVLGKNVTLLMTDEDKHRHDDFMAGYLRAKERRLSTKPRRVIGERRDGEQILLDIRVVDVVDDQGHPYLFIGFLQPAEDPANTH